MPTPEFVYKIATADVAAAATATGRFAGMPIDMRDGYIHLSTATQLAETLRLHFASQSDLALLALRTADYGEALRWEPSRGGQLFPHLYGTFPMSAVVHMASIDVGADGTVVLPDWVR
jgi:uncharacterized protein (DUF952 family)